MTGEKKKKPLLTSKVGMRKDRRMKLVGKKGKRRKMKLSFNFPMTQRSPKKEHDNIKKKENGEKMVCFSQKRIRINSLLKTDTMI